MTHQRPGYSAVDGPVARIVHVTSARDVATLRRLFREYAADIDEPLCFEGFEDEVALLPRPYAPPAGALLLARVGGKAVGTVATRRWSLRFCEMKRLSVRPEFRGQGVGRALAQAIIGEAQKLGYGRMRLDSLDSMRIARSMYRSLGFREIRPYLPPSAPKTHFLELRL
ncbi:MAG: GNAT family N-acetyltransferase [Thermoplasmata archaeon]|nr:GNAT family N-acetyltransferase [Thermoplasmata archaeon]